MEKKRVRCEFIRQFHRGSLTGCNHPDMIEFVSMERAADWLAGIARNSYAGLLNYTIFSVKIEEI